jgi:hypothetical protein
MSCTGSVRLHISAYADVRFWLTLDLKTEADRAILKKLVAAADVFVENYCLGALAAGHTPLSEISPSAFGSAGLS